MNKEQLWMQIKAFYKCVTGKRKTVLSPTGSGKSFIQFLITKFLGVKTLIVVPRVGLGKQMISDFIDYGFDDNEIYLIQDTNKKTDKQLTVSTWQSIYKQPAKFFNEFECIIIDEVHEAEANSLKGIMEKATDVEYRFGFTGTLKDTKTNDTVIRGLFGKVYTTDTTKGLMDKGILSDMDIFCIKFNHYGIKQKGMDYQKEFDYIIEHKKRNRFIANLAMSKDSNTMVLFKNIRQGKQIYDKIKGKNTDHYVFYIDGDTDKNDREDIRKFVEDNTNCIIVASYGTFSTGVNIRNIHNIIFASPYKSLIKVLQSIGRGLRKHESKETLNLYDLADDFNWDNKNNVTLDHLYKRIEIYIKQQFSYKIKEIDL